MNAQETNPDSVVGDVVPMMDHLFRQESGKLVSVLTGIFGIDRLQLAEDVVQEAFVRALQTWPYYGIPKNAPAWLTQTAKNLALDTLRREKNFLEKQPHIIATLEHSLQGTPDDPSFDTEIKDDRLRMMFVCSHPEISPESQVALALKTLCGFSPIEIASAFLTTEAAVAKRLTRAKQRIRELRIQFEIPSGAELPARLDGVQQTLYLLFNEGYKASTGDSLIREDLCHEAIRLGVLLVTHPAGDAPRTHALLALMHLNAARFRARVDSEGNMLRLKEQDRSLWDRAMINRGLTHLGHSASGEVITEYHLQAGIAACHCVASDYESTDWKQILALYDRLLQLDHSPVIALNRSVALANISGPGAGIAAIEQIPNRSQLESYYLLYAVLAEFESQRKNFASAVAHYRKAEQLTSIKSEQVFLANRRLECER